MTDPIEPATDEEIERWRRRCEFGTQGCVCDHRATDDRRNCITIDTRDNTIARIIARFDAEKARAEALYASCEQLHNEAGEWKARAEKAEAQSARMREVLMRDAGLDVDGYCVACGENCRDFKPHTEGCIVVELLREKGGASNDAT